MVLVLAAVCSSLGFYSYLGFVTPLIVLEVVPFLVLAIGVDKLFIIVHSFEVYQCVCVCALDIFEKSS